MTDIKTEELKPSPELVAKWWKAAYHEAKTLIEQRDIFATKASEWGAQQAIPEGKKLVDADAVVLTIEDARKVLGGFGTDYKVMENALMGDLYAQHKESARRFAEAIQQAKGGKHG